MAKSFCSGCKYWVWHSFDYSEEIGFHYCEILETHSLRERKFLCHGKFRKEKK